MAEATSQRSRFSSSSLTPPSSWWTSSSLWWTSSSLWRSGETVRPGLPGEDEAGARRGDRQRDSAQWLWSQFGNNPLSHNIIDYNFSMKYGNRQIHQLSSLFSPPLKKGTQQCRLVSQLSISAIAAISFFVSPPTHFFCSLSLSLTFSILCADNFSEVNLCFLTKHYIINQLMTTTISRCWPRSAATYPTTTLTSSSQWICPHRSTMKG